MKLIDFDDQRVHNPTNWKLAKKIDLTAKEDSTMVPALRSTRLETNKEDEKPEDHGERKANGSAPQDLERNKSDNEEDASDDDKSTKSNSDSDNANDDKTKEVNASDDESDKRPADSQETNTDDADKEESKESGNDEEEVAEEQGNENAGVPKLDGDDDESFACSTDDEDDLGMIDVNLTEPKLQKFNPGIAVYNPNDQKYRFGIYVDLEENQTVEVFKHEHTKSHYRLCEAKNEPAHKILALATEYSINLETNDTNCRSYLKPVKAALELYNKVWNKNFLWTHHQNTNGKQTGDATDRGFDAYVLILCGFNREPGLLNPYLAQIAYIYAKTRLGLPGFRLAGNEFVAAVNAVKLFIARQTGQKGTAMPTDPAQLSALYMLHGHLVNRDMTPFVLMTHEPSNDDMKQLKCNSSTRQGEVRATGKIVKWHVETRTDVRGELRQIISEYEKIEDEVIDNTRTMAAKYSDDPKKVGKEVAQLHPLHPDRPIKGRKNDKFPENQLQIVRSPGLKKAPKSAKRKRAPDEDEQDEQRLHWPSLVKMERESQGAQEQTYL